MFSRTHAPRGNETYRFSTTYTLSDSPLLIGEILRRKRTPPKSRKLELGRLFTSKRQNRGRAARAFRMIRLRRSRFTVLGPKENPI